MQLRRISVYERIKIILTHLGTCLMMKSWLTFTCLLSFFIKRFFKRTSYRAILAYFGPADWISRAFCPNILINARKTEEQAAGCDVIPRSFNWLARAPREGRRSSVFLWSGKACGNLEISLTRHDSLPPMKATAALLWLLGATVWNLISMSAILDSKTRRFKFIFSNTKPLHFLFKHPRLGAKSLRNRRGRNGKKDDKRQRLNHVFKEIVNLYNSPVLSQFYFSYGFTWFL